MWLDETKKQSNQQIQCVLVGNKADLIEKREVSYQQADNYAKAMGIAFIETSAKTGENVT